MFGAKTSRDLCKSLWWLWGQVSVCQSGQRSERGWHNPYHGSSSLLLSMHVSIHLHRVVPSTPGPTQFWVPGLLGPHTGLPVSLPGVTEVLWIDIGVCSVLSAGHWHVWLMSARPQRNAPDWRHCTDSTFGLPWKQGRVQLPLPWHPLVMFSNSDLFRSVSLSVFFFMSFFLCLAVSLFVCLFLCLLFTWLMMLSRELEVWDSIQGALYSWAVKVCVILIGEMKDTGIHPWTDHGCIHAQSGSKSSRWVLCKCVCLCVCFPHWWVNSQSKSFLRSSKYMATVTSLSSDDFLLWPNFSLFFSPSVHTGMRCGSDWP